LRERLRRLALDAAARIPDPGSIATRVVPGEGDPRAALVIVGEAPGREEDATGRPFVGAAGRLLDRLLEAAGLARERLWLTNVVKRRLTSGKGAGAGNRAPRASEVAAWAESLAEELRLVRPRAIVGLGRIAGQALAGRAFPIAEQRGRWFKDRSTGADALVTWHPAYLLFQRGRNDPTYRGLIAEALRDLREAKARLDLPEQGPAGPQGASRVRRPAPAEPTFTPVQEIVRRRVEAENRTCAPGHPPARKEGHRARDGVAGPEGPAGHGAARRPRPARPRIRRRYGPGRATRPRRGRRSSRSS
jgi:DNA polymerase